MENMEMDSMEIVWSFYGPKVPQASSSASLRRTFCRMIPPQCFSSHERNSKILWNMEKSWKITIKTSTVFLHAVFSSSFDRNKKTTSAFVTKCRKVAAMRQAFFGALWPSSRCLFFVHPSVTLSMKTACAMQSQWLHVGTCNLPEIFRKANGRNHSGILWSWLEISLRNCTEHVLLRSQDAMMRLKIPIVTWCWPQIRRWPHSSRVSSQRDAGHGHWTLSTSPITTGRQQKISCRKYKDKQRQGQEPQEPEQPWEQWEQWKQWESDFKNTSKKMICAIYHINDWVNIFGIWSGSRHLCWWFKSFKAQRETAGCRSSWKGNHISDAKSPARPVRLGCLNYSEFVPTWYSTHIARKW